MRFLKAILFIFLLLPYGLAINAQIKPGSTEFPKIGTNFIVANVKLYPKKKIHINDIGLHEWDISGFGPDAFDTLRLKKPKKTKYGKRFPAAQLAIVKSPIDIEYLRFDSGKVYQVGLIGDFLEVKIPVLLQFKDHFLYENDEIKRNIIYGDTSYSKFCSPYYHKPGTDSIKADIAYEYEARIDARGYLKTPLGRYKTVREVLFIHKRVRGYKYSVFGWTPAPEYSLNKRYTVYRWFTAENGLPIAEVYINKHDYIEKIRYQYDSPMRLAFSAKHVSCKGGNDGFVELLVSGGIPDYEYEWSNGNRSKNLINTKAGTYNVTVTDNKGRKISGAYTLTEPLVALDVLFDEKDVSCRGANNGSVAVEIVGGEAPYDFIWSNDSTNYEMHNLRPGTYWLRVKDAGTCVLIDSVVVRQPDEKLHASLEKEHVTCHNGSNGRLLAVVGGGTPPYRFKWSNADTSYAADGLKAGTYRVTVTDANGCSYSTEATVKQPPEPLVITKTIKPVSCFGGADGSVKLSVKGGKPGYAYFWSDSTDNKSIKNVASGYYHVEITDNNNCVLTDSVFVPQPNKPLIVSHGHTDISCFGKIDGTAIASASGGTPGYNYLWSNGSTKNSLKKIPEGIYTLKISDRENCTVYDTVEVFGPQKALFVKVDKKDIICKGKNSGEIQLIVEGGTPEYSILWHDKTKGLYRKNLKAGKYSFTVTDKHKCKLKDEVDIKEPKEPLQIKIEKIDVDCPGQKSGSVYITASGGKPGYSYEWSNGEHAQSLIGLGAGEYTVRVTDNNSCAESKTIKLNEPTELKVNATIIPSGTDNASGSIKLNIKGGTKPYSILWDDGQTTETIKNLSKSIYGVTITDAKDCQLLKEFKVDK